MAEIRGREALAVNHGVALPALGTRTDPLCLVAWAPDHKSTLVCKQIQALLPRGTKLPDSQYEPPDICLITSPKCPAA